MSSKKCAHSIQECTLLKIFLIFFFFSNFSRKIAIRVIQIILLNDVSMKIYLTCRAARANYFLNVLYFFIYLFFIYSSKRYNPSYFVLIRLTTFSLYFFFIISLDLYELFRLLWINILNMNS